MTIARTVAGQATTPRILVVDDDRRVLELLEIAFTNQGFRVLQAADGDEAVRVATQEKPDLVVLDVRLPRRSGLDVCEMLRRDHPEGAIPIVIVSAAVETETRLQAFSRGADDFLAKPFSPKELVARVRRLLARTSDAREARRRVRDLESELGKAREGIQRAHLEASRESRLRRLATGPGQALHRSLDADEIVQRLLFDAQTRLGAGFVALLWSAQPGEPLRPWAVRGESLDRIAALELAPRSLLADLVDGLGRPVLRRELERFPELRPELPAFLAYAVTVMAPIGGDGGLEALIVADERPDGSEPTPADLELLSSLCEIASVALRNAARVRQHTIVTLERVVGEERAESPALEDALRLTGRAAQATLLPPRSRTLLDLALRLGPIAAGSRAHDAASALLESDATGLVRDLLALEERSGMLVPVDEDWLPEDWRAPLLLAVGRDYLGCRAKGAEPAEALESACAARAQALDPATEQALRGSLREESPLRASSDR
jgi:DNA-binding response OmpR family regulator